MSDPRDQRQRDGVGEVAADDAQGRQLRIEEEQHRDPEGAGADRRNRDKYTEEDAGYDRDRGLRFRVCGIICVAQRIALEFLPEDDGAGGEQQRDAERYRNDVRDGGALLGQVGQGPDGQNRGRDAAGGEEPGDAPVDVAFLGVDDGAAGLGDRCVEQVGTHRGGRMDAEEQHEQRRHQGAAADARKADDAADDKTRQCVERIHDAPWKREWMHGSNRVIA